MALRLIVAVACAALLPRLGSSQSLTVDVTQTAGYSTEDVGALGTQARALAETASGLRFNFEAAWAARSATASDVFGAAYPYANRLQVIEAFAERTFLPGGKLFGVRAGRFRTPFGISSGSDHAYLGFHRAPLIRYDGYYALSNYFLEHGVNVVAGVPSLSAELSAGVPADLGDAVRRSGLDLVARGQGTYKNAVAGVSYIRTNPYLPASYATGRMEFGGVDVRWMHAGIQVRGEWLTGKPFDGTTTHGGYVDVIVHRPRMGVVTALFRAERLDYDAQPPHALYMNRYSAASSIRLFPRLSAQVAVVHQPAAADAGRSTALDLGVMYSLRPH
jgi:hypothetical protein